MLCIPLYSNSSMQGAGGTKSFLKNTTYPREITAEAVRMVLGTTTCLGLNALYHTMDLQRGLLILAHRRARTQNLTPK